MAKSKMSLDTYANGAMKERFLHEFQRVSANIGNPNTSAAAKRTITLKIVITPEGREEGDVEIFSDSKLAPIKSVKTRMRFGIDEKTKEGVFAEVGDQLPGQMELEDGDSPIDMPEAQEQDNVQDIKRWKRG